MADTSMAVLHTRGVSLKGKEHKSGKKLAIALPYGKKKKGR